MITVHNLENSQSIRILWLLEELGVEYKIQQYSRRRDNDLAPEEYRKIHPLGTSPAITDGDIALAETNAIVDYILDKHPSDTLRPLPDSEARVQYLFWLHATQGTLMPLLIDLLMTKRMVTNVPFFLKPIMKFVSGKIQEGYVYSRGRRVLSYMDAELSKKQWLTGDEVTAADIVMGYCLEVVEVRMDGVDHYKNVWRYLSDLRARPAYKIALEKNGPFRPFAE